MRKSRTIGFLIALSLIFTQLACGLDLNLPIPTLMRGSGNVVTEQRDVSGYKKIILNGAGDLTLLQGSSETLILEAEDNILPLITSEVKNGTLELGYVSDSWKDRIIPTKGIKYILTVIDLEEFTVNGGVKLENNKFEAPEFKLIVNGVGDFNFDSFNAASLEVEISGGASVKIAGEVGSQEVVINGAGNYSAADLKTRQTKIVFNGAGSAVVWATEFLDMKIDGAGSIDYYGTPQVTQNITGLGNITHKGDK